MDTSKYIKSAILKAGRKTFFFDISLASNNKRYLRITQSMMPEEEGGERKRASIILFPENIANFQSRLSEMVGDLVQAA